MTKINLKRELDDWINEDKVSKNSINSQILEILKEELKVNKRLLKKFKTNFAEFFKK